MSSVPFNPPLLYQIQNQTNIAPTVQDRTLFIQFAVLVGLLNKYADITIKQLPSSTSSCFFCIKSINFGEKNTIYIDDFIQERCRSFNASSKNQPITEEEFVVLKKKKLILELMMDLLLEEGYTFKTNLMENDSFKYDILSAIYNKGIKIVNEKTLERKGSKIWNIIQYRLMCCPFDLVLPKNDKELGSIF
ncbi:TATA-binding protein-associated phosphoprotein [Entamoeba marina]